MKSAILIALLLVCGACNEERRLKQLMAEVQAAEMEVQFYSRTPAEMIGDAFASPEMLARVTAHYNAIRRDSLPAAQIRETLARRKLRRFLGKD